MRADIEEQLRQYIVDNFMYTDHSEKLTPDLSLIDSGIMDSTGALELVGFIEETFGIKVDDVELVPDNFDSLTRLTTYIQGKLADSATCN